MQIQKPDIRKIILEVARIEFIENGFKNTSMRTIAKKADVGLSNIYNYFENKNVIFNEVLSKLINALDKVLEEHNKPEYISLDIFTSEEYMRLQIDIFVELVTEFKNELKLLFFQSHGSNLENYREEYTDKHTEIGLEYIQMMKKKFPAINANVSEFFIHTMSSSWMSVFGEIVSHDISTEEIEKFISEYMAFGTAGWKKVLRI